MFPTANEVLLAAAAEAGLVPVSDPWAAQGGEWARLRVLLAAVGDDLATLFDWPQLSRNHTFVVSSMEREYDLPDDFLRMVSGTQWDIDNEWAVRGPLSPVEWADINSYDSNTPYMGWRFQGGRIVLYPEEPPDGVTIRYEYISKNWVNLSGSPASVLGAGSDRLGYDRRLLIKGLVIRYKQAKGVDATPWVEEFGSLLREIAGDTLGGRRLLLSGDHYPAFHRRAGQFREGGIGR